MSQSRRKYCRYVLRYNLLHHVAGEIEGVKGAWAYPEGGMGAVSAAICSSVLERGAHVFTGQVSLRYPGGVLIDDLLKGKLNCGIVINNTFQCLLAKFYASH